MYCLVAEEEGEHLVVDLAADTLDLCIEFLVCLHNRHQFGMAAGWLVFLLSVLFLVSPQKRQHYLMLLEVEGQDSTEEVLQHLEVGEFQREEVAADFDLAVDRLH